MAASIPSRLTWALRRRWNALRLRGDRHECPSCGLHVREFLPDHGRPNAVCPRCGAHERHRRLVLFLNQRPDLVAPGRAVLHFAPEHAVRRALDRPGVDYTSVDVEPGAADVTADIAALPFPDASFDTLVCSHVLEHVTDDGAAMAELYRVLRPDGSAIVMVPIDSGRPETYEDPAITAPAERERAFWQADHVRLYGRDFADRLAATGFAVETAPAPSPQVCERHALGDDDVFLAVRG